MADWASISGQRIISGVLTIPYYGAWVADVVLASDTVIGSSLVSLTIGDLTLAGTVYRQFSDSGSRSARLAGGYGGWRKTVPSRAYQSPIGVGLAAVLNDLIADCGESLGTASQPGFFTTVGTSFVRESAPAVRILKQLTGIWWIDTAGATQIVDRASLAASGSTSDTTHLGAIGSQFNLISWSGAKGRYSVATESLSDWMPGRTFSNANVTTARTISSVTHVFDDKGKARTAVLVTP